MEVTPLVRVAYADPPYVGQSARKYRWREDYAGEVDHAALIARLQEFDGWALSASSTSLAELLRLCPSDVRIGAWVKPYAWIHPTIRVTYAWEPVIFSPARTEKDVDRHLIRDWVSVAPTMNSKLPGQKPQEFCSWLFEILGLRRDDELVDLFPGSGAVTSAWDAWRNQLRLAV